MKTYEGTFLIKWHKNDYGDKRPLTLDLENNTLSNAISNIKNDFMTKGEDGRLPYSIKFNMSERI